MAPGRAGQTALASATLTAKRMEGGLHVPTKDVQNDFLEVRERSSFCGLAQ